MGAAIAVSGTIGLTAALAVSLAAVGGAAAEAQRASGIADAAALAAADALSGFAAGDPCDRAARIASAQAASVTSCDLDGLVATVSVSTRYARIPVAAVARAGPPL